MTRSLLAGAAYFVIVFAAAFALGALRVTFLVPAVGDLLATALELPFTLAVSWIVCRWLVRRFGIRSLAEAMGMAASAFALLMGAEVAGSVWLFGRSVDAHIGTYLTLAGGLGLAGQLAFGLFPVIAHVRNASAFARTAAPQNVKPPVR